jgi:hypothetical protein
VELLFGAELVMLGKDSFGRGNVEHLQVALTRLPNRNASDMLRALEVEP